MTLALHVNSEPVDGWYFTYSTPTDPLHPYKTRHKVPVLIWTYALRDETGDLLDDVKQWAQFGDVTRKLDQEEWLYIAKHPISQAEYQDLYDNGTWRETNAYASQYRG